MACACPKCGEKKTWVVDTSNQEESSSIKRIRRCDQCFTRFQTIEGIDRIDAIDTLRQISSQLSGAIWDFQRLQRKFEGICEQIDVISKGGDA